MIAEEQAKLGYMKEPIRLYYPLSSLHHFFESEGDAEAMQESLSGFPEATKEIFGEVQVSHKGDRFPSLLLRSAPVRSESGTGSRSGASCGTAPGAAVSEVQAHPAVLAQRGLWLMQGQVRRR